MPALYLFGRRTLLGGDDLQLPALGTIAFRLVQFFCLVVPIVYQLYKDGADSSGSWLDYFWTDPPYEECQHVHWFPFLVILYLTATTFLVLSSIGLESAIYYWTCYGNPTEHVQERSQRVEQLVEIKLLAITVVQMLLVGTAFCSTVFAPTYQKCQKYLAALAPSSSSPSRVGTDIWWFGYGLLMLSQLGEVLLSIFFLTRLYCKPMTGFEHHHPHSTRTHFMTPANSVTHPSSTTTAATTDTAITTNTTNYQYHYDLHSQHEEDAHSLVEELWADRCHWLCHCIGFSTCFVFGGQDLVGMASVGGGSEYSSTARFYEHVAKALADYLETRGVLDVVPTDIVTGLLVYQKVQRHARLVQRRQHQWAKQQQQQKQFQRSSSLPVPPSVIARGSMTRPNNNHHNSSTTISTQGMYTFSTNADASMTTATTLPAAATALSPSSPSVSTLRSRNSSTNDLSKNRMVISSESTIITSPQTALLQSSIKMDSCKPMTLMTPSVIPRASPKTTPARLILDDSFRNNSLLAIPSPTIIGQEQEYSNKEEGVAKPPRPSIGKSPSTSESLSSLVLLNPHNPVDVERLQLGAHYSKYALAIYTWMLYVYVHPLSGIPRLIWETAKRITCRCSKSRCIFGGHSFRDRQRDHRRRRRWRRPNEQQQENNQRTHPTCPIPHDLESTEREDRTCVEQLIQNDSDDDGDDGCWSEEPRDGRSTMILGDNLCRWHQQSLLLTAQLSDQNVELVYAQFLNKFGHVPYCILLDHSTESVVVAVRGTLSLEDLVTDVWIDPKPLVGDEWEFLNDPSTTTTDQLQPLHYCHGGVLACTKNLHQDLQRHGLLERLLEHEYPQYALKLVGHSLGAATCTMLGFLLQRRYPTLHVFNYSPPGMTMTWDLAMRSQSFATTYVLDSDIVPRLSVHSLEVLRDESLKLLGRIKVPKYQIAQTFLSGGIGVALQSIVLGSWCCPTVSTPTTAESLEENEETLEHLATWMDTVLYPLDDELPDTPYQRQLRDFLQIQQERKKARGTLRQIQMFPPGRIVHIVKTGETSGCCAGFAKCMTCCMSNVGFTYAAAYVHNDQLNEILVSPTMATDHFIDRMCMELETLSKDITFIHTRLDA